MTFGKDIIFTYGPLSSVFTKFWVLQSFILTVILSFTLSFSLTFFVYRFFDKANYLIKLLLVIFFYLNINIWTDFFLTLLPAVAALYLIDSYSIDSYSNFKSYFANLLFAFSVALLLLIKLSFGVEALLDLFLLLVFYIIKKDLKLLLLLLCSFIISFVVLYVAAGQRIADILYYPLNIYYGVAGYVDAMSIPGEIGPVIVSATFLILLISYSLYINIRHFNVNELFRMGVLSLLSLVVFKHGFVTNHAGHHVDIYLLNFFLMVYILHAINKFWAKNILITFCMYSLFILGAQNEWYFFNGAQIQNSYSSLNAKYANLYTMLDWTLHNEKFQQARASINHDHPLPTLKGTSDIFNYNQAILLASDNKWNPRPAFQSYQAVTPYLAKINYNHFLNDDTAPDNIFFKIEPIEGRLPSLADGLSWKAMLGLYKPVGWTNNKDYLILNRRRHAHSLSVSNSKLVEGKIGQEIVNPYENGLVFLKVKLRKSLPGALLSVFYKTEPVFISVKLQNGHEKDFRIIPSMSETGFLLSPFVENTTGFSNLYAAGYFSEGNSTNRVKSVVIKPNKNWQYSNLIEVTFELLEYPDKSTSFLGTDLTRRSFDLTSIPSAPYIDYLVENFYYQTGEGKLFLDFSGWAFKKNVDISESHFSLLLIDQNMEGFEIPLLNVNRKGLSDYINDGHNYAKSGYSGCGLFNIHEAHMNIKYKLYLRLTINKTEYIVSLDSARSTVKNLILKM